MARWPIYQDAFPLNVNVIPPFEYSSRLLDIARQVPYSTIGVAFGSGGGDRGDVGSISLGGITIAAGRATSAAIYVANLEYTNGRLLGNFYASGKLSRSEIKPEGYASIEEWAQRGHFIDPRVMAADAIAAATLIPAQTRGRAWKGVYPSAKAGAWVRRLGWSDATQKMRFEPGRGTAPAVFVITGSGIATRPVQAADFTVAEWLATDWVLVDGPPPKDDLTEAVVTIFLSKMDDPYYQADWHPYPFWLVFGEDPLMIGAANLSPGTGGPSGSTGGTDGTGGTPTGGGSGGTPTGGGSGPTAGTTNPDGSPIIEVRARVGGVEQWIATAEYTCPG